MSRRTLCTSAGALLAAGAMLGGPVVAGASASDTSLKLTLGHAVPQLSRSQLRVAAGLKHFTQTHSDALLLSAVRIQDNELRRLKTRLGHESASSRSGTRARTEILRGLGLILSSNAGLTKVFRTRDHGGNVTASELATVQRQARQGNAAFQRGVKTLDRG
jgi:hypothetical protein